ncbi:hypothetical protein GF339_12300 [candidate division KSB3 bacterium]|uniref:Uncharacterized protein n=1 Tax=candidate division KSB3 bacterium TaxID=2044937 RepID=A0A9D5Q6L3_9BACT|nr:hypothetical protein [candidate division KSB3 bacterium]MBD3325362.1 hypothetical protein [candidate division KSB3 bacterium]
MKKLSLLIMLVAVALGVKAYLDHTAQQEVEAALNQVNDYVDVHYDQVKMDVLGWNAHLKNVTIAPFGGRAKTQVEDIIIYEVDYTHEIPAYLHLAFKGLRIEVNAENFGAQAADLNRLGYTEIRATMEVDYRYDPQEKSFRLNTFRLGADAIGHVHAACHIGNIDLNVENPFFLLLSYPKMLIHSAELRYEDD